MRTLAFELSKVKSLNADKQELALALTKKMQTDAVFAAAVLAAIKLNEDFESGLLPAQFGDLNQLGGEFGKLLSGKANGKLSEVEGLEEVNLSPFLKSALVELARAALSS